QSRQSARVHPQRFLIHAHRAFRKGRLRRRPFSCTDVRGMKRTLFTLLVAFAAIPAFAQSKFNAGLAAGTLGGSVSASYRVASGIGLRATYNRGSYTRNFTERDVNYDATLKLDSLGGLIDFYPTGRTFRLTGGVLSNRNRVEGITTENNFVEINK